MMGIKENLMKRLPKGIQEEFALRKAEKTAYEGTLKQHRATARVKAAVKAGKRDARAAAESRWPKQSTGRRRGHFPKRSLKNLKGMGTLFDNRPMPIDKTRKHKGKDPLDLSDLLDKL